MTNARTAQREAAPSYTIDVLAQPITLCSFSRSYAILYWPPRENEALPLTAGMEFSADPQGMQLIEKEAQRLIAAGRYNNAKWETLHDEGGAAWCVGELIGPRPLVVDLASFAETKGFTRLPFPF
jgi:hypothetical protein